MNGRWLLLMRSPRIYSPSRRSRIQKEALPGRIRIAQAFPTNMAGTQKSAPVADRVHFEAYSNLIGYYPQKTTSTKAKAI